MHPRNIYQNTQWEVKQEKPDLFGQIKRPSRQWRESLRHMCRETRDEKCYITAVIVVLPVCLTTCQWLSCQMLYRESRDEQHYIEYRRAVNRVRTGMRKAVRDFDRQIARDAKVNPKAFYKYATWKMKIRSAGVLSVWMGHWLRFNTFFTRVLTLESLENIPTFDNRLHNTVLQTYFLITKEEVEKILNTLNTIKPPGPDGLHPRLLFKLIDELFQKIFTKSLVEGSIPPR